MQVIDLDPTTGLFATALPVPIEGVTGIDRIAVTNDVTMGQGGVSGDWRFAYMIGDDQAVHVADVTPGHIPVECDTQVDPRYLQGITDVSLLPCFGVGLPSTPPRRPAARGPGIRLPGDTVPFDVGFIVGDIPLDQLPGPNELNGVFAVVTGRLASLTGAVFYINVDDDNYEDFPDPTMPGLTDPVLALPHTLRDGINFRRQPLPAQCVEDPLFGVNIDGPVRIFGNPAVPAGLFDSNVSINVADYTPGEELKAHILPLIHLERCEADQSPPDDDLSDDRPVWQLSSQAPAAVRLKVFADLARVPLERWTVAWEGRLARTAFESVHQGAVVQTVPGQLQLVVHDDSRPFCDMGVEPGDRLQLVGCVADADCGLTETCFIHPEAPAGLGGMCLPRDRVEELAETCRQLLISTRTYLVARRPDAIHQDQALLVPSPSLLQSSPVDGCTGVAQCNALYNDEVDQLEASSGLPESRDQTWTCRADDNLGGPARCIATCPGNTDDECPVGAVCQDLTCVEGAFPAQECLAPLELYEARAQGAFTVVGSTSGYVHHRIVDPSTGVCMADPTASPLEIGRFSPTPPACTSDDLVPDGPNPCSVTLDEPVAVVQADGTRILGRRASRGVRFRNLGLRIDFADLITLHPRIEGVLEASYPPGYAFTFDIGGGFTPRGDSLGPGFPSRVVSAPDGAAWIVDSGDSLDTQGTLRRGVLYKLTDGGVTIQIQ
jgi:hypothetical protein